MQQQAVLAIAALRNRSKGAQRAAKYLRIHADAADQTAALQQLPVDDPMVEEALTGRLFARTWQDVFLSSKAPLIAHSQRSLNWLIAVFERHSEAIREHVSMRKTFEAHALHGRWDEARDLLARHHRSFGPSLWQAAWLFVVAEETRGIPARREITEQFRRAQCGQYVSFFAWFFGLSADKGLPERQFRDALTTDLRLINPPLRQLFELVILEDQSSRWLAWEMLRSFEFLPLIDRYELFIRLCANAAASEHSEAPRLEAALGRIRAFCSDARVDYLSDTMSNSRFINISANTHKLLAGWDAHLTGNYTLGYEIAKAVATEEPDILVAHETLVRCAMQLGITEQLAGTTPLMLIWQHLRNILAKNENAEESVNYLRRFARRFRIFSLTGPLRALHARHLPSDTGDELLRRGSYTMTVHSPRNFERGHTREISWNYLDRCIQAFPESVAMRFLREIQLPDAIIPMSAFPAIMAPRQHLFAGLLAARRNEDDIALRNLNTFLDFQTVEIGDPLTLFTVEEARKALADVYRRKDDIVKMQTIVIRAYQERPASIRSFPIRRIFRSCQEHWEEASRHVEFAILAYLACDGPHDVSLALRTFLRTLMVDRPSRLIGNENIENPLIAILFLRVCTWEVLDSFWTLNTTSKVEAERLELLSWVSRNDPALSRLAETETLRLTQEAQLREALQKIEGARVALNLSGLREAEQTRFTDAYFRFAVEQELGSQIRSEALDLLPRFGAATPQRIPSSASAKIQQSRSAEISTFASAFTDIRDAFLSSPHFGVDACLSGRIRHGILVQHLRKPFVEQKLMVREDVPERADIEAYWQERLGVATEGPKLKHVMAILFLLTRQVEAIAEEVKNKWIQVRTETRTSAGLFDYTFTDSQLRDILQIRLKGVADLDSFLDSIFDVLLDRTREALRLVQTRVRQELFNRMTETLDHALKQVGALEDQTALLPLRNNLVFCRSHTERTCQQMARWFAYSDPTLMGDVDFGLVAHTAVGMVERLNSEFRGRHEIDVSSSYRLKGRYFTAFVHILFFLLDNAIRNSRVPNGQYRGKVVIAAESNQLSLTVENRTQSTEVAEQAVLHINTIVNELRSALDPLKIVKEGGTGFAKIIATVRYEFKQQDPSIDVRNDNDCISICVGCQAAGLVSV